MTGYDFTSAVRAARNDCESSWKGCDFIPVELANSQNLLVLQWGQEGKIQF